MTYWWDYFLLLSRKCKDLFCTLSRFNTLLCQSYQKQVNGLIICIQEVMGLYAFLSLIQNAKVTVFIHLLNLSMKKDIAFAVFILFGVLLLPERVCCGAADIALQIDQKAVEKQAYVSEKDAGLLNLYQANQVLRGTYLEWIQAKLGALDAYRQFYMENIRCQIIGPTFQLFIKRGTIPETGCLPVPASSETLPFIVRKYILANAEYNTLVAQQIVNTATSYAQNADEYFNILKKLAFSPIEAARAKFTACMAQYASQSNQHPAECAELLINLNRIADLHQQKYIDAAAPYGQFIGKLFYIKSNLTQLQKQLTSLKDIEFQKRGDVQVADVSSKYSICQAGLSILQTSANTKLSTAKTVKTKLDGQKDQIEQLKTNLDATVAKAETATTLMLGLLEQVKQSPS